MQFPTQENLALIQSSHLSHSSYSSFVSRPSDVLIPCGMRSAVLSVAQIGLVCAQGKHMNYIVTVQICVGGSFPVALLFTNLNPFSNLCAGASLYFLSSKVTLQETSLAVQWLRLHLLIQGVAGSIPCQGVRLPGALGPEKQNIKQKQYCSKFNEDFKNGPY